MPISQRLKLLAPCLLFLLGAAGAAGGPLFTDRNELVPPADYREWVFLEAGIDMSYNEKASMAGHSMFDNVFVDPASWASFKKTGHWPDKTMLVLEVRGANSRGSINKHGQYQTGDVMGLEIHVRDEARFKGGWGFFQAEGAKPAKLVPYDAQCYTCHQTHGTVDTTFVQFYPTARPIAMKAGTYREDLPTP
jgi:hypothetical protein